MTEQKMKKSRILTILYLKFFPFPLSINLSFLFFNIDFNKKNFVLIDLKY